MGWWRSRFLMTKSFCINFSSLLHIATKKFLDLHEAIQQFSFKLIPLLSDYSVNLSVAIVAMTENRTVELPNGTITHEQYFPWDSKQKGYILSSFFYGYLCTQVIGGVIAAKIGGNLVRFLSSIESKINWIYLKAFRNWRRCDCFADTFHASSSQHESLRFDRGTRRWRSFWGDDVKLAG